MSIEEREDRLGELSRDLAEERKELEAYDLQGQYVPPGQGFEGSKVADLQRETGIIEEVVRGIPDVAPELAFHVQSTYDSRPVQATDWQASGCDTIVFGTSGNFDSITFSFTVPENKIAVLRGFRYQVTPIPVGIVDEGDCWLQSDIFDSGVPVPQHVEMFHPVFMQKFFPTFVIFDERRLVQLRLSQADVEIADAMDGEEVGVLFELFGNLILKTGIPKEFQIANRI